jgi:hypothetical protein
MVYHQLHRYLVQLVQELYLAYGQQHQQYRNHVQQMDSSGVNVKESDMLLQTLKVLDEIGTTVFTADKAGIKDASNRVLHFPEYIYDRLFATPLAAYIWTCVRGVWKVSYVNAKYSVVGGSGAAVDVLVCSGVTAPGSGVTQLTGTIALTATAPASVNGTLIASPTLIQPGDSVARVISGTPGSLEGAITIELTRVE